MSLRARLLNRWLKLTEKPHLGRASLTRVRRSFEAKARILFHPPKDAVFEPQELVHRQSSVPALGVAGPSNGPVILYFHGGGYGFGSPRTHRAMIAWLCRYAGAPALATAVPPGPGTPFPRSFGRCGAGLQGDHAGARRGRFGRR